MPELDLTPIRERVDSATPGPWEHDPDDGFNGCGQVYTVDPDLFGGNIAAPSGDLYPRGGYDPKADMAFIAHARTDVPALLDELEAARAKADRLAAELDNVSGALDLRDSELVSANSQRDQARADVERLARRCAVRFEESEKLRDELDQALADIERASYDETTP